MTNTTADCSFGPLVDAWRLAGTRDERAGAQLSAWLRVAMAEVERARASAATFDDDDHIAVAATLRALASKRELYPAPSHDDSTTVSFTLADLHGAIDEAFATIGGFEDAFARLARVLLAERPRLESLRGRARLVEELRRDLLRAPRLPLPEGLAELLDEASGTTPFSPPLRGIERSNSPSIGAFMSADHERLGALLARADGVPVVIDREAFEDFRAGLLRHIAMEEKVLLPFARECRGGEPLGIAKRLRDDHGRIAKLLVPTPTHDTCAALRDLLRVHDALEEGPGALYAEIDALAGPQRGALLERLRARPAVPLAPHYDGPAHRAHRKEPP